VRPGPRPVSLKRESGPLPDTITKAYLEDERA